MLVLVCVALLVSWMRWLLWARGGELVSIKGWGVLIGVAIVGGAGFHAWLSVCLLYLSFCVGFTVFFYCSHISQYPIHSSSSLHLFFKYKYKQPFIQLLLSHAQPHLFYPQTIPPPLTGSNPHINPRKLSNKILQPRRTKTQNFLEWNNSAIIPLVGLPCVIT